MKKAVIVYCSRTGRTRQFAAAIGAFLATHNIETEVVSIADCDVAALDAADYVLLGCWTSGLMVIGQHPDRPWVDFVRDVPELSHPRVGLFTTYKLLTGSMFPAMRRHLAGTKATIGLELKSRSATLTEANRKALEAFLAAG